MGKDLSQDYPDWSLPVGLTCWIYTPDVVIGTKNPPGFEGSKQAEAKDPDKDNA